MTTVNRLKNKSKHPPKTSTQQQPVSTSVIRSQNSIKSTDQANQDQPIYNENSHCPAEQQYYQGFSELSLSNPNGVATTCSIFPHSSEMNNNFNIPLAFIMSPLLFLQNEHAQPMNKSADQIPRCSVCRAYMNCFNKIDKKKFTCFLCNRDSYFEQKNRANEDNDEFSSSIYQALSPSSFSSKQPSQQAFIFMVDISQDPFISKMLYYATAAIKQVLSREDLDDILIHFFTFDELIHYYEFTGQDVKCTIYDGTIQIAQNSSRNALKDIRQNLFVLLDSLDEISKNNQRKGYNFSKCFNSIFSSLKHLGGKFFIFQSNQQIKNQQALVQKELNPNSDIKKKNTGYNSRSQSFYETNNKQFFNTYAEETIKCQCSMSLFCFASNFKNVRIFADVFKISSSQLKLYSKDVTHDLDRFYYDLYYLLGANYFWNVLVEFIVSAGWVLLGIYGNYHRIKDKISFQINSIQPTRKIVAIVSPSPNTKKLSPFCCMQMITNYKYKKQSFIAISTIVQPVTGYTQKLYRGINPQQTITAIAKKFLSTLRMEPVLQVRRKTIQMASKIYINALNAFRKQQKIPDIIFTVVLSILAMLKSGHCHPELINGTPTFDRIISERNILQFAGPSQVANRFNPYLFDLTHIDSSMCNLDQDFIYPPALQLKFSNVKSGIYLLDNGLSLTLFVGKQCDPNILSQLFGKSKIEKNWRIEERQLLESNSEKANKVVNLITLLRQQKSYGWIPLHIVKCGENTANEKDFYLNFIGENYEQFREYRASFEEFIAFISKASC